MTPINNIFIQSKLEETTNIRQIANIFRFCKTLFDSTNPENFITSLASFDTFQNDISISAVYSPIR